ncbi:glycosyltransferase [Lachnospiraceae bacterium ZAX-1]
MAKQENGNLLKNKILIIATAVSSLIYITWRIFFTVPFEYGVVATVFGLILLIVEIVGLFELLVHIYNMSEMKYPQLPVLPPPQYPDVDVFIATFNEPYELLYKTVHACVSMDYPDKDKVHIYLCDDGKRTEMEELANRFHIHYLASEDNKYAKAGNLNHALEASSSPLILTLDADMIPMHDFLTAVIPYFFTEEKVGFVQTPQSFYNPDLFQYNLFSEDRIPNEQDYFYRDIQVMRNKSNSVIYGGTNAILLRQAIKDIGGFVTGIITEDFATGIEIQSKGYVCYAIPQVHASGLSPSDLDGLLKQRQRWGRGCIQTGKKRHIIRKRGLNFTQKVNFLSSISYWYSSLKRIVYIFAPIMFSVFQITVIKCTFVQVVCLWLPMYLLTNTTIAKLSGGVRNTRWTNVYETILCIPMLFPIIFETIGFSQKKFLVTNKSQGEQGNRRGNLWAVPYLLLVGLSLLGMANCIRWTFKNETLGFCVVLFWLLINLYYIVMSIFFLLSRTMYRKTERIPVELFCQVSSELNNFECKTKDASEGGVSFVADFPYYFKPEEEISIKLYNQVYESHIKGRIVQVNSRNNQWVYAVSLMDYAGEEKEKERQQLYRLLYDRVPMGTDKLGKNISMFDDLQINIFARRKATTPFGRKLPRIFLDRGFHPEEWDMDSTCPQGGVGGGGSEDDKTKNRKLKHLDTGGYADVILKDFNYEYAQIKMQKEGKPALQFLTLPITKGLTLECTLVNANAIGKKKRKKTASNTGLYKVDNYMDLILHPAFRQIIIQYIKEAKAAGTKKQNFQKQVNSNAQNEFNEAGYLED